MATYPSRQPINREIRQDANGTARSFCGAAPGNVEAIILQVRLLAQQSSARLPETQPQPLVRRIWAYLSRILRTRAASPGGKAGSRLAARSHSASPAATYSPKHG